MNSGVSHNFTWSYLTASEALAGVVCMYVFIKYPSSHFDVYIARSHKNLDQVPLCCYE